MKKTTKLLLSAGICIAWSLCALAPIWKYLSPIKALLATLAAISSIAYGMYWLDRFNKKKRHVSLTWFLLLYLAFAGAYAILYPLSLKHTLNRGSDREDALRIELIAIEHHQYPYAARTFLGNPPTPLPGALLLASPFFEVGHIAWQNFLWLAFFFYFTLRFFRFRATALFFLAALILFSPSMISDLTSGGDYLINFFYVAIATAFFVSSLRHSLPRSTASAIFLGLALSSRSLYLILLLPLLALTLQRTTIKRSFVLFGAVFVTMAIVMVPIFMPHPITNFLQQASQNAGKLRYIPASFHAQWTLPLLGFMLASTCFFLRMNLRRLFIVFGISNSVILAPPVVSLAFHTRTLPYECSYLCISVLPFCLWALSRYESLSQPKPDNLLTIH